MINPGFDLYYLQCKCKIDCRCDSEDEVPRIHLDKCYYVGELDYIFLEYNKNGLAVQWHCDCCLNELACGMPSDV